jgi:hypothetical protein
VCVAGYHHVVAVGRLVLDGGANIGETGVILSDSLNVALAVRGLAGKQAVIDEVGGEQFVDHVQVALGLRLQEAAHHSLILFLR